MQSGGVNMVHWTLSWETEAGSAGEQPAEGYHGQAHQTMRGRDVQLASRPTVKLHRMIDLSCLKKRTQSIVGWSRKLVSKEPGAPQYAGISQGLCLR